MNYFLKGIKIIIFYFLKCRILALVLLFAIVLNSIKGLAQNTTVYRFTNLAIDEFGNATNIPEGISRETTKRLIYLRSLKTASSTCGFSFKEVFKPASVDFTSQTYNRIYDHYFILLDSNEVSSFKYTFNFANPPGGTLSFGQELSFNSWDVGIKDSSKTGYDIACLKNLMSPESKSTGSLTNALVWGIAPTQPTLLTVKAKSSGGSWVQSSLITEGQSVKLNALGGGPIYIYQYSWYNASTPLTRGCLIETTFGGGCTAVVL